MKTAIMGFVGRIPLVADHLLPENAATQARNCDLQRGRIEPLKANTQVATPSKAGTVQSLYKYGNFWFNWLSDVDCVRGPVPGDTQARTYYTGDGAPKMTIASIATGGADYPTASYTLGIPAPASAPSAVIAGTPSPDPPNEGTQEDRVYVYTYVSALGEEGAPSSPSAAITWAPGMSATVTTASAPVGNYNITKKRIYRSMTTDEDSAYFLVAEVAVGSTSFSDTVDNAALSYELETASFDPPPSDLFGLCSMPGGMLVGFSGNRVCFSEPYQPHAWPVDYRLTVDDDIVGGGVFGNSVLITTKDNTYVATGDTPDAISIERLEVSQSCVSKRGIADMGTAIFYPSPDGLMMVGVSGIQNVTRKVITRDQWQAYAPSSLLGLAHDGRYYGFYDNGTKAGFVFDPATGSVVDLDVHATAGYSDPLTDTLYLVVAGKIVSFNTGSTPLTATWQGREYQLPKYVNIGAGQVFADGYPLTLTFTVDGTEKAITVSSEKPFHLPSGMIGRRFKVRATTTKAIDAIVVGSALGELR